MTAPAEGCLKKGKGEEALVELQVYAWTVITVLDFRKMPYH